MPSIDFSKLAFRWSPINYQYIWINKKNSIITTTTNSIFRKNKERSNCGDWFDTKQDLVVPVNLEYYRKDKDLDPEISYSTKNQIERLNRIDIDDLTPVVYYSIALTQRHLYILYSFFHAYDTTHPNDMEGCLLVIEHNNKTDNYEEFNFDDAKLLGMITVAHTGYPLYVHDKEKISVKKSSGFESHEMFVETVPYEKFGLCVHPLIQQESGKHGLYGLGKAKPKIRIWRYLKGLVGSKFDKIKLYPKENTVQSSTRKLTHYSAKELSRFKGTPHYPVFLYNLENIKGLYDLSNRYKNLNNTIFVDNGNFHGNDAKPPWNWKHKKTNLWSDPARVADNCFKYEDLENPMVFLTEHEVNSKKTHYILSMDEFCNI